MSDDLDILVWRDIVSKVKNFFDWVCEPFYRLKTIIDWFPILWHDYDWDKSRLFRILEFKLRRMEEFFRNHGHHVGDQQTANKILEAAILCKRLRTGTPHDITAWTPRLKMWQASDGTFLEAYYDEYLEEQDLARLTLILKKHVRGWWD